jgi:hypothetical protein
MGKPNAINSTNTTTTTTKIPEITNRETKEHQNMHNPLHITQGVIWALNSFVEIRMK